MYLVLPVAEASQQRFARIAVGRKTVLDLHGAHRVPPARTDDAVDLAEKKPRPTANPSLQLPA